VGGDQGGAPGAGSGGGDAGAANAGNAASGAGGNGGGRPPGAIDLSKVVDEKGMLRTETHVSDPSGTVSIVFKATTQALTRDRRPLTAIQVQPLPNHPLLPDNVFLIGRAQELGPTGATFDPPITITMGYDPAAVPTGLTPDDLELAYFDVNAGKWQSLPGAVDAGKHTVSATTSHFTTFAVLTKPPAGVNWLVLGVIFAVEAAFGAGAFVYLRRRQRGRPGGGGDEAGESDGDENGFDLDGIVVEEPVPTGIAGLLPRGRRGYTNVIEGEIVPIPAGEPSPPIATADPTEPGTGPRPIGSSNGTDNGHDTRAGGGTGPAARPEENPPPAPKNGADPEKTP
jgi:hypothetical protein